MSFVSIEAVPSLVGLGKAPRKVGQGDGARAPSDGWRKRRLAHLEGASGGGRSQDLAFKDVHVVTGQGGQHCDGQE